MDFPTIDLNKKPPQPKLSVAKCNKQVIGILKESYDIVFNPKLGGINQLSFKIPVEIDLNNQIITNPNIDKIKFRYLIKFEVSDLNYTEWFIVINPQEKAEEDAIYKEYICYSLAHELSNKIIRNYSGESLSATEVLTEVVVANSTWTLDYIDATFDLRYRQFDVSQSSVLDFLLNDISEAFNALVIFNTENRTISLYQPQNYGLDKGLTLNYGQYLKEVSTQLDHMNFCTRLRPFGREGIGIQRLTPTGSNYIENFDIFKQEYFSDNLLIAQNAYESLLETKQGEFDALLADKTSLQSDLATKTSEWNDLYTELLVILDSIDVGQANGDDVSALIAQRDAKQAEIDVVETEIDTINSQIDGIDASIAVLRNEVSLENNFSVEEIEERDTFVIEKIFENQHIFDDEDLYELAIEKLDEFKSPPVLIDVDIVDFTSIVENQLDWDKLSLHLGDVVRVRHPKLDLLIQAKIVEATINYETQEINLIIANIRNLTDQDKVLFELNKSFHSSTTVDMSKFRWDGIDSVSSDVQRILNDTWEAANTPLSAAVEGSLTVDGRGLTSINHAPPITPVTKGLRIMRGALVTSTDGFNTANVAVTGDGVFAERVVGALILGSQLHIINDLNNISITEDGLRVIDPSEIQRVFIGNIDPDNNRYGMELRSADGNTVLISDIGLLQSWSNSMADNVDSTHKLKFKFYIPDETISVRQAKLNFSRELFRAYNTGAASGGGHTTVSGGGHTTASGGGSTSGSGGGQTSSGGSSHSHTISGQTAAWAGSHIHSMTGGNYTSYDNGRDYEFHRHQIYVGVDWDGYHNHDVEGTTSSSESSHTHTVSNHQHSTPDHTHQVRNHSHQVSDHTHPLSYGIYESTIATNIRVYINGIERLGPYTTDQSNLDLSEWITEVGQWYTIELSSSQLGRINATIFLQVFLGV